MTTSPHVHGRRALLGALAASLGAISAGCASLSQLADDLASAGAPTSAEISAGLKEALAQGASRGVTELSRDGGYRNDSLLRIPFPKEAQFVADALEGLGFKSLVTNLEDRLNRGAEVGARRALPIFQHAIEQMTLPDAMGILTGGEHAATDYFRARTLESLTAQFRPEIAKALGEAGATTVWTDISTRYNSIPFVSTKVDTDIVHYATERALDGLFTKIAAEESAIRADPVARTTELLQRVFGYARANAPRE